MSAREGHDAACVPQGEPPYDFIEVEGETLRLLKQIAKLKNCTLNAALEEVIREFDPQ